MCKQSENTDLFYSELYDWMKRGCVRHPFFKSDRKIFANAVLWDSQDMATAKEVMAHMSNEPGRKFSPDNLIKNEIREVLMLENGNYYKSPEVISFVEKHLPRY